MVVFCKVVEWAELRRVLSHSQLGNTGVRPYLQTPQKSSRLCSLSLWKVEFQSCYSLPVLRFVCGLLYSAVKPMKVLLLCETSSGAKRAMLSGVTVNSYVAPKVSCVGGSHPLNFMVLQCNTDGIKLWLSGALHASSS